MRHKPKLKPGQIRFTPPDNRMLDCAPTVNTIGNPPTWFKRIGKHPGSIRRCAGTIDLLAAGVTLPLWTNYRFRPHESGMFWETGSDDYSPPADIGQVQGFGFDSTGSCPMTAMRKIEEGQYPKLVNPWRIETAPGWSTLLLPLYWEPNPNFSVVPAIVHTDYYHTANIVLNITSDAAFTIPFGTPIAQLIPFKRSADFSEIDFADESDYKYVATRGFGMGSIAPRGGTAGPYRRHGITVDKALAECPEKHGIINRVLRRK